MVVRIRFAKGPQKLKSRGGSRRMAGAAAALLALPTVMTLALAAWNIAAGMNWTNGFAISKGFFSHWQSWLALAALLQLVARILSRYSRGADSQ